MLGRLLQRWGLDAESRQQQRELTQAIESLVDGTDKRLRLSPGYLDALAPGMRVTQAYLAELPSRMPEPLALSLRGFAQDPRLGLLFSGPASLLSCLRQSEALRNFFLSASQGDEAWALLSMARSETGRLGVAMEGGELRREVPQQVVSFDGHRLAMPCASRELLLESSARRSEEMLITVIARRLSLLEQLRQTLDNEMSRLQLRLSVLRCEAGTVVDGSSDGSPLPDTCEGVQRRMAEIEPQLREARGALSLEGLLETVRHVLEHPAEYFRLEWRTLYLNRMGIKQDAPGEDATELEFEELVLGQAQPLRRALMPVRVTRQALAELEREFGSD